MLTYYQSGSNQFTIRTAPTASSNLTLSLQDMYTQANTSESLNGYTYNSYESLLTFNSNLLTGSTVKTGDEFRATISDGYFEIWHGSIQVYVSQSVDKPNYTNQIPEEGIYVSNVTDNQYIILE